MRLKTPKRIQTNEAMVITAGIFFFSPLMLTWPVMATGVGFTDALFETVSAVTTTGLSAIETLHDKPATFLFSRAWMQWVGGLGIVVLCVAAMLKPGLAAKRLDLTEDYESDVIGSTRTRARRTFVVYTLVTLAGIALLMLTGEKGFESILYTLAAVSTGGFAPHDDSLQGLGGYLPQAMVILTSMAGSVSLALYERAYRKGWQTLWMDRQFLSLLAAGGITTALLTFFLWYQDGFSWRSALGHGALNALSAQSTAGFASLDLANLGDGSKLTLVFSMAIGGGMGSTAGGIKLLRLLVLLRLFQLIIQQAAAPPNAVAEARLGGRRIETDEIKDVLCIVTAFIGLAALSWLPFVALGHAPLDALFEVVSALSTAGLSTGITGADLHPLLKAVLCLDMLLGRLEIIAWLVVFYPPTWMGMRRKT
jgi:trk system potassium uptake protein TrkH